ncbi:MAG: class I SAM-dependent methyltransferase [Candidatus Bathyarchaeia archaeon]
MENQNEINKFYQKRLKETGSFYQLRASQMARFRSMTRHLNFKGKDVLDIGCGTGDFLFHLSSVDQWPRSYIGIDVLEEALETAKERFDGMRNVNFYQTKNYLEEKWVEADIVVGIGLFALKFLKDERKNCQLVMRWFEKMFSECREACGATFLSVYKWEIRDGEAVFKPDRVFEWLKPRVERLLVDHSYAPHVFTVIGVKGETPWHREVKLEKKI